MSCVSFMCRPCVAHVSFVCLLCVVCRMSRVSHTISSVARSVAYVSRAFPSAPEGERLGAYRTVFRERWGTLRSV